MSEPAAISFGIAGNHGRLVLRKDGHEAELTFSVAGDLLWIADHTGVPEALRGTGAGLALVARLVAEARNAGRKVLPLCPFVKATARRHPEWADVFQG